jgi:aspartokinase-like uncharacterized kinase
MTALLPRHVVKLGGSMLGGNDIAGRLRQWIATEPLAQRVLIVGGGALVDGVREFYHGNWMDERTAHWICVDLMSITARLIASQLPEAVTSCRLSDLRHRSRKDRLIIFDIANFLRHEEPLLPGTRLEECWDVTSDSIAARLAIVLGADKLVLLKPDVPPSRPDVQELVYRGYLDRFFLQLRKELPATCCVNLMDPSFAPTVPG